MTRKLMLLVKRPDGTVTPVPVDDRVEAEAVIEIARLMMNRDINGTPVTIELVEYEDTPL
jgi:hypothetical protein